MQQGEIGNPVVICPTEPLIRYIRGLQVLLLQMYIIITTTHYSVAINRILLA